MRPIKSKLAINEGFIKMSRYAIGDIQGCYKQFIELLKKIDFNPTKDVLYLVGDLVNRGSQSLEVMKWVYKHQNSVINVLGNHDFYLIARYHHLGKVTSDDTLSDLIRDKNINKYIDWLRSSPIIFHDNEYIMSHAGVYPCMNFNELLHINHMICNQLRSAEYPQFIEQIFGNKPNFWSQEHDEMKKMRFAVNSCTRMRFLDSKDFSLDFKFKGEIGNKPDNLIPWFRAPFDKSINKKIVFGHWAALGYLHEHKFLALDTGCVWGRKLTAFNLDTEEIFQVDYSEEK